MPNHLDRIKINELESPAHVNRYFMEQCVPTGLLASLYSLIAFVGIPFTFRRHHSILPIRNEYKMAIGAISAMIGSYFIGDYAKKKCEQRVKQELAQHFLPK